MKKILETQAEVLVIGDIHEHPEQFFKLLDLFQPGPGRYVVSVGDVYDKGFGKEAGHEIAKKLIALQKEGLCFAVRGNHEDKMIKKYRQGNLISSDQKIDYCFELEWFSTQPFYWRLKIGEFDLLIVHGGITPKMAEEKDLTSKVAYVREIDPETGKNISLVWKENKGIEYLVPEKDNGVMWHEMYDGRFGYVASGHEPQKEGQAKFYQYSCNLDSCCYETGKLTGAVFGKDGLKEVLVAEGRAARPKIEGRP